jgi:hypothetical protein
MGLPCQSQTAILRRIVPTGAVFRGGNIPEWSFHKNVTATTNPQLQKKLKILNALPSVQETQLQFVEEPASECSRHPDCG